MTNQKLFLIRHGETEWTLSGQHTGTTDIPLTANGQKQAEALRKRLHEYTFKEVFTSPLKRARQTCEIAGFHSAKLEPDLQEWNYGEYEGLTSKEIQKKDPGWTIFSRGAPGGESIKDIEKRASRVLARVQSINENVALFSHGHFLRALAACWLKLSVHEGRLFSLSTASLSILGVEKNVQVLSLWNELS